MYKLLFFDGISNKQLLKKWIEFPVPCLCVTDAGGDGGWENVGTFGELVRVAGTG